MVLRRVLKHRPFLYNLELQPAPVMRQEFAKQTENCNQAKNPEI